MTSYASVSWKGILFSFTACLILIILMFKELALVGKYVKRQSIGTDYSFQSEIVMKPIDFIENTTQIIMYFPTYDSAEVEDLF